MGSASDPDWPIRAAAFATLRDLVAEHGAVLHWSRIASGFKHGKETFLFANQSKGIFRPSGMVAGALSIKSSIARNRAHQRYEDVARDGAFDYAFQDRGLDYHDNQILVRAHQLRAPIIYFYGVEPSYYRPLWPAYVANVDVEAQRYAIVVDEQHAVREPGSFVADGMSLQIERRYKTVLAKRRLHQEMFAHLVIEAYRERCAICNLPRRSLIDAAHIVPDRDERGSPTVPNGLALCKLHHAAFDANLIGIRPDSVIEVSTTLLDERDGPTLEHAIKSFNGRRLRTPRRREDAPSGEGLSIRYEVFRRSG